MRVLVLTHNYPRFAGDPAGAFIARLAAGVRAEGCDVLVLAPHAPGVPERGSEEGVSVIRFRYAPEPFEVIAYRGDLHYRATRSPAAALALPFFLAAFRRAARRAVHQFHPDLVHAHWWIPAGRVAARLGHPYVVTCHGTDVRLLERSWLLRRAARSVFGGARAVTAVSRFLAADIPRWVAVARGVKVTPMPLDVAFLERGRSVPKAVPPRVLFVGNLVASKGVDLLIRAARLLRDWQPGSEAPIAGESREREPRVPGDRSSSFQVRIVGDGMARPALEHLARREGVANLITWAGRLPHTVMPEEYGAATVTVLPSRGRAEGLGLALAEALLAGCAVVGSPAGGIPEVVVHGETGLLAKDGDPGDLALQLRRMLTDARLRERTVAAGCDQVRRIHGVDRSVSAFLEIYDVAVGQPGR